MNKFLVILSLFAVCGCINQTIEAKIEPTKQWENHYFTTEEFKSGTQSLELKKGESVWVLSDSTLSRLLKNIKEK